MLSAQPKTKTVKRTAPSSPGGPASDRPTAKRQKTGAQRLLQESPAPGSPHHMPGASDEVEV